MELDQNYSGFAERERVSECWKVITQAAREILIEGEKKLI